MSVRLFVAIGLPDQIRATLALMCSGLEGARWVPAENMHVTLRFIGHVSDDRVSDIDWALRRVSAPAFSVTLKGIGHFGDKSPDAVWVGVEERAPLAHLAQKVDRAVVSAGLDPESRKYIPHVTLARFNRRAKPRLAEFEAQYGLFSAGPFDVTGFTLFESIMGNQGPHYEELAYYPLDPSQQDER